MRNNQGVGMIPQDFIQTLLSRVDIVDVIGRHVTLKKAGANFQACCPFHQEKSPSFTVSPTKQFYHCFGCGAHGTAIGFLMEYVGVGYVDAIQTLASQMGISVPQTALKLGADVVPFRQSANMLDIMQRATLFYRQQLKLSGRAITYLKARGLTGEIAAHFGLGYSPDGWQNLAQVFDYDDEVLTQAGLVVASDAGKRYDRFRDRIMFPIWSQKGEVIGFGGRVLDSGEPKYLNSPETPLFQKGNELYGLFQARRAIRDADRVLVVEGYMDVLALVQHGVDYVVATLGTATTAAHVQKLLRHTDELVYCFDGDAAGRRAAWRALEQSLPVLTDVSRVLFLFLPQGHDPDSYVRERGAAGFVSWMADAAVPLSAYLFQQVTAEVDLALAEGRSAFLKRAQPLVMQVTAPALALMLRRRAAELAQVDMNELARLWQITETRTPYSALARASRPAPVSVVRKLLRIVLFRPQLAGQLPVEWLAGRDEDSSAMREVLEILLVSPNLDTAALMEYARGLTHGSTLTVCAGEIMSWDEHFDVIPEFELALAQLRASHQHQRLQVLAKKLPQELSEAEKQELRLAK